MCTHLLAPCACTKNICSSRGLLRVQARWATLRRCPLQSDRLGKIWGGRAPVDAASGARATKSVHRTACGRTCARAPTPKRSTWRPRRRWARSSEHARHLTLAAPAGAALYGSSCSQAACGRLAHAWPPQLVLLRAVPARAGRDWRALGIFASCPPARLTRLPCHCTVMPQGMMVVKIQTGMDDTPTAAPRRHGLH
jgi:hypothetical protein